LAESAGLCEAGAVLTPHELLSLVSGHSLWARVGRAPTIWT